VIVFMENETFVSYCPELDISRCGNGVEHAKEMLKTDVRLFIEEAEKMGTLESILEESTYKKDASSKWIPPKLISKNICRRSKQNKL
jgi:hypothetical protein